MMRACLAGLFSVACVAVLSASAGAAQDEIVPQGVWLLRTELATRSDSRALDRARNDSPLLDYLVPDETVRSAIDGSVERDVRRAELQLTYGLRDTWNLALSVSWAQVEQRSTLTTASVNPAVLAEVDRQKSRTVSGLGTYRLTSLHRPVFKDRHAFVYGYGLDWPSGSAASAWAGPGTLLVDSPFRRVFGLVHYTYYPGAETLHFDLRSELGIGLDQNLELAGGGSGSVNPGNDFRILLGWGQEFGPLETGLAYQMRLQSRTSVDGVKPDDDFTENRVRVTLGFGNLRELERGPVAFPYALELTYDHTVLGVSTPLYRELRLGLRFYF
jgi:hypothetical protein